MSLQPDGSYACDRCGGELENDGIQQAAIIADLHPDNPSVPRSLHLCREPRDGHPRGCVGYVLGPGTLTHWTERQD